MTAAVPALRTTWRRSAEHFAEQVTRFVRLLIVSAIPVVTSAVVAATVNGQHFDPKTLLALLVPVAEVAYRQVFPALGAAHADNAPGVTIVPAQVGLAAPVPAAPADAMPDPMGEDPGPYGVALALGKSARADGVSGLALGLDSEAGHSELLLLLVIIAGVFVGGFLLHLALT